MGIKEAARALRNGDETGSLVERLRQQQWQGELLQEDMRRLELEMRDEGWRRMGMQFRHEFTRQGIDDICDMSRMMYMSNPLIKRAVNVTSYYTWAQGVSFTAEDEGVQENIVNAMTEDVCNIRELYGHQARLLADVDQAVDGNTFVALFTPERVSQDSPVQLRTIPTDEVRNIIVNPDDHTEIWFYHRSWSQENFSFEDGITEPSTEECYYPDVHFCPVSQPEQINGVPVMWNAPVVHQKTGAMKLMRFGVPEVYAALDWARAYKTFLEDWHTLVRSLSRFAWAKVSQNKAADRTKLGTNMGPGKPTEGNRAPAVGSVALVGSQDELTPIPKTGATTSADDARPARMMVGAATDLPDTILSGDPQKGNLATAKTLDRPTELAMLSRQKLWADYHKTIFNYALEQMVYRGPAPGKVRVVDGRRQITPSMDAGFEVNFPSILEHDLAETVTAIVSAATLEGKSEAGTIPHEELSKLLMSAVGVDDVEAALQELEDSQDEELQQALGALKTMGQQLQKPPPGQPGGPVPGEPDPGQPAQPTPELE